MTAPRRSTPARAAVAATDERLERAFISAFADERRPAPRALEARIDVAIEGVLATLEERASARPRS